MNDPAMTNIAVTVSEAATDAAEIARHLGVFTAHQGLEMSDFDRERTARILDRLAEELAEAAADLRRAR